jgi:hypothetical protein
MRFAADEPEGSDRSSLFPRTGLPSQGATSAYFAIDSTSSLKIPIVPAGAKMPLRSRCKVLALDSSMFSEAIAIHRTTMSAAPKMSTSALEFCLPGPRDYREVYGPWIDLIRIVSPESSSTNTRYDMPPDATRTTICP